MSLNTLGKITLGTAGGALIEGIEQTATLAAPAFETVDGSADPLLILKIISQIAVALATIISLFIKPKPKQPAADPLQPFQVVRPASAPIPCTFEHCPFPEVCTDRCVYPEGTEQRLKDFQRKGS